MHDALPNLDELDWTDEGQENDPSLLAYAVGRAPSRREQVEAWEELWAAVVKPMAGKIKSKFGTSIPHEFVEHSAGLLWEKLTAGMYDWRFSAFPHWCYKVLLNAARDQYKGVVKGPKPLNESADRPGGRSSLALTGSEVFELIQFNLNRLRGVLDELADSRRLRAQVNYFAVLLVELRRGLVTRLKQSEFLPGLAHAHESWAGQSDSAVVRLLLPWHEAEQGLRFRPIYPPIGQLWQELERYVDGEPHDLPAYVVRQQVVNEAGVPITQDCWYNWTRHLRRRLTEGTDGPPPVDAKTWAELFEPWSMGES